MSAFGATDANDNSANPPACQPAEGVSSRVELGLPAGGVAPPPEVTPTEQQAAAIRRITEWFKNGTSRQQVFRLFGYAGTGKTTLTRLVIEELGLASGHRPPGTCSTIGAAVRCSRRTPARRRS
jgi:hypothetical protein